MDYKSIRNILDAPRDKLEDLALRIACEYPKEFRHCAILNGLIDGGVEALVTWDGERVELTGKQMSDVRTYAEAGQKVEAIKALREATHIGLKDALETIKQMYPQFGRVQVKERVTPHGLREAFAPVQDERTFSPLFYPDRRPTDPGYVEPLRVPEHGMSLGELLQQQIDHNVTNEKITEAMDEIDKAFNR